MGHEPYRLKLEDGSVWPNPANMGHPSHSLRYAQVSDGGGLALEKGSAMEGAAIIDAFMVILALPRREQMKKLRMIDAAMKREGFQKSTYQGWRVSKQTTTDAPAPGTRPGNRPCGGRR